MDEPAKPGMRVDVSTVVELAGFGCLAVAAGAWDWRALLALIGLVLVAVSYMISR